MQTIKHNASIFKAHEQNVVQEINMNANKLTGGIFAIRTDRIGLCYVIVEMLKKKSIEMYANRLQRSQ